MEFRPLQSRGGGEDAFKNFQDRYSGLKAKSNQRISRSPPQASGPVSQSSREGIISKLIGQPRGETNDLPMAKAEKKGFKVVDLTKAMRSGASNRIKIPKLNLSRLLRSGSSHDVTSERGVPMDEDELESSVAPQKAESKKFADVSKAPLPPPLVKLDMAKVRSQAAQAKLPPPISEQAELPAHIRTTGFDSAKVIPNFEAKPQNIPVESLNASTTKDTVFIGNFFRAANTEANTGYAIRMNKSGEPEKVKASSLSSKDSAAALKSVLDSLQNKIEEVESKGGDASSIEFAYAGNAGRTFGFDMVLDAMPSNAWVQSTFKKHPELQQKYEALKLGSSALAAQKAFTASETAWKTHTPMLHKLASLAVEPGETPMTELDRGSAPTKQLLGLENTPDGQPKMDILSELSKYKERYLEGIRDPNNTYIKLTQEEIERDSKAGKDVTALRESLDPQKAGIGGIIKTLGKATVVPFGQREKEAMKAVKDLFDLHCEKNYAKTFHSKDQPSPEKKASNEQLKTKLQEAGLSDFDTDRGIVVQQFLGFDDGKRTLEQVFTSVNAFIEKYPVKGFMQH